MKVLVYDGLGIWLAARRLNTSIIDWNKIIDENAGIISDDLVHPNQAGVTLLSKAYLSALEDC